MVSVLQIKKELAALDTVKFLAKEIGLEIYITTSNDDEEFDIAQVFYKSKFDNKDHIIYWTTSEKEISDLLDLKRILEN